MKKEFLIGAKLQHPNIVEYKYFVKEYNINKNRYRINIIMEYIQGKNLSNHIKSNGKPKNINEIIKFEN